MEAAEGEPAIKMLKIERQEYVSQNSINVSDVVYDTPEPPLYGPEEEDMKPSKNENILSKAELYNKIRSESDSLQYEIPKNTKSSVWSSHDFRFIFHNGDKQKFVICMTCKSILSYTGRTGTASLLRHKCEKRERAPKSSFKQELGSSTPVRYTEVIPAKLYRPAPTIVKQHNSPTSSHVQMYSNEEHLVEIEDVVDHCSDEMEDDEIQIEEHVEPVDYLSKKEMSNLILSLNLNLYGPAIAAQRIVEYVCKSCRSLELLSDPNFVTLIQSLLELNEKDRNTIKNNFEHMIHHVKHVLLPNLERKLLSNLKSFTDEFSDVKFATHCLSCDLWPKRSLLWVTLLTEDFHFRKLYVGSVAEQAYNPNFLTKLIAACDLQTGHNPNVIVNDEVAGYVENGVLCILDSIRQIFVDFFNSIKSDEQFMQMLLYFYNFSITQHNDPNDQVEPAVEISLDLDFTMNLAHSYNQHKHEIGDDDSKPCLDAFFGLVQNFVDCIESLTAESNPTINEVYLWKKKLERVFDGPAPTNKLIKQIQDIFASLIKSSFVTTPIQKMAVFFDPNFKSLKFLKEDEKREILSIVRARFEHLKSGTKPPKAKKEAKYQPAAETIQKFAEFVDDIDEDVRKEPIDYELQRYVDLKLEGSVDMLEFWRTTDSFPNLKQLCREVLSIPACSHQNLTKYSSACKTLKERCALLKQEEFNTVLSLHYAMK